jgi:predicted cobalt transporter CbtA
MRRYLVHGACAGATGGLASMLMLLLVGERSITRAIAIERARRGPAPVHEMFSRRVQLAGGGAGTVIAGIALGLVLAVVFASVRHRLAGRDDWRRATTVAATAFVTVYLVPWLKYPANPPAVGDPATIGRRTALYLVMIGWSIVASWAAWRLHRWLRADGRPEHQRVPATVAAWAAMVAVALVALPGNPDAVTAPAQLVWRFRLASLGGAAAYWAVCGTVFGWLRLRATAEARPTLALQDQGS